MVFFSQNNFDVVRHLPKVEKFLEVPGLVPFIRPFEVKAISNRRTTGSRDAESTEVSGKL